jgi:vacuolar-type H+-ATPase subunit H
MEQTGEREERVMRLRKKKTFMDQATDFAESLLPTLESAVETAREKAGPLIQDAKDRAVPLIHEARDNAAPLLAQGRSIAAEKAAQASSLAAERAAMGLDLAQARLAELNGEEPKRKTHRLRKLVLLGAVAGLGAVAYKKVNGGEGWQASYAPEPPPAPSTPSSNNTAPASAPAAPTVDAVIPETVDDAAAASPDEAISDAATGPHAVTDPDHPAEVVALTETPEAPEATAVEPAATVESADEAAAKSPYGAGSALPLAGGASPDPAYTIKGNADSMLFHTSDSPWFNRTIAEVWFTDERAAEAAGFRHWRAPKD